jgi:hypothetical protein
MQMKSHTECALARFFRRSGLEQRTKTKSLRGKKKSLNAKREGASENFFRRDVALKFHL